MGRMLEALKRTDNAEPMLVPVTQLAEAAQEESAEEEMPFVEVGGPRKSSESKPHLELPAPSSPTLEVWAPKGVALQSASRQTTRHSRLATELIAFHQPDHAVSLQYAALFPQLCPEPADSGAPAFVFTALAPGAGTTTTLLNLAIAGCLKQARRIVVVDANLARPAAALRLGLAAAAGLCDVLEGKAALEQAIQSTALKGLDILPAGRASTDTQVSTDAFRWVLAWLGQRYDAVLVDAPAWSASEQLRGLFPAVSAVYLVVDANEADKPEIRAITREVARQGSRLGGLIVTR